MSKRDNYFFRGLLFTALAVAIPLTALQCYSLFSQRSDDLASTKRSLHTRVEQAARFTDNAFSRIEQMLTFLATRPELQSGDAKDCLRFIQGLTTIDPLLGNVVVVDLQGKLRCRAVDNARGLTNFADRPWFKAAIATDGQHFSAPYQAHINGRWQVNIVQPLRDATGTRQALLVAGIDVGTLADRVYSVEGLPEGSVFGLVSGDGTVLAINHAEQAWIGRKLPSDLFQRLLAASQEPIEAKGLKGSQRVLASTPLRHFGLYAGIGVSREAAMAGVERRTEHSALVAVLTVMAALTLALFGAKRLSQPVLSLVNTARQVGKGDMNARADENLPGEFQLLACEFNKAMASVAATEEARRAQLAAEAASLAKSEFLANMSHEIRTPMNAVIGMTDLALREPISPKVRDYLRKVHLSARNLLGIINDILDFSKIEAGKLEIERVEFRLQDVLDRVTAVVGMQAQKKGLELLISTAPDVPQMLIGDPLRLEQVLVNLCNNAVKFTEEGEIVVVSVRPSEGDYLRLSVRDTGPGMTAEQTAHLFQPFQQLESSTTRRHGGTGLGLAICKQLVELMGGEIGVRSQPGKGSEFFFTVKMPHAAKVEAKTEEHAIRLNGCRVLVVDDSMAAQQIFTDELVQLGAQVEAVGDGHGALERMRASPEAFDVVLVDLKLPDTDGFSLIAQMRAATDANCRYLLVSAYGNEEVARQCEAQGLDGCLFKPVNRHSLAAAIDQALNGVMLAPSQDNQPMALAPPALRGAKVLLVEDNEFNQIVAGELLGSVAGMDVTVANSGQQALHQLEARRFDILLMDVQMPDLDGFEVTRLIRAQPQHQRLPVVAMTAYAMERDRQRCLDAGMNDFITKPVEPAELFAVLSRWLSGAHVLSRAAAAAPAEKSAKHVDVDDGRRRCLGRKDLYDRIVTRFIENHPHDGQKMLEAARAHDLKLIEFTAHAMTSSAGMLGAQRLSEISKELQSVLHDSVESEQIAKLAAAFAQEHQSVLVELHDYVNNRLDPKN